MMAKEGEQSDRVFSFVLFSCLSLVQAITKLLPCVWVHQNGSKELAEE